MRLAAPLALALAAACGEPPDPCAGVATRCVALDVRGADGAGVTQLDHLEVGVLYGDRHAAATTAADGGRVVALPVVTAIELPDEPPGALAIGVVAAGKLGGVVLGTGAASTSLEPGARATLAIRLAPPRACVGGGLYCGGDKVAGDPDTLYECNEGGVPLARGRCVYGCIVDPGRDDTCRGGGGTCVEGGYYCGGDKLDGDPQTLYRCAGGVGVGGVECADGCIVSPPGVDDRCR